jgi:hypothetical protein
MKRDLELARFKDDDIREVVIDSRWEKPLKRMLDIKNHPVGNRLFGMNIRFDQLPSKREYEFRLNSCTLFYE